MKTEISKFKNDRNAKLTREVTPLFIKLSELDPVKAVLDLQQFNKSLRRAK